MDSRTTGTTAAETKAGVPATAGISPASPTAISGSQNTEPTQQDWLEIFLGLAAQLEFPAVRLRIDKTDKLIYAIILDRVVEDDGELIIER